MRWFLTILPRTQPFLFVAIFCMRLCMCYLYGCVTFVMYVLIWWSEVTGLLFYNIRYPNATANDEYKCVCVCMCTAQINSISKLQPSKNCNGNWRYHLVTMVRLAWIFFRLSPPAILFCPSTISIVHFWKTIKESTHTMNALYAHCCSWWFSLSFQLLALSS